MRDVFTGAVELFADLMAAHYRKWGGPWPLTLIGDDGVEHPVTHTMLDEKEKRMRDREDERLRLVAENQGTTDDVLDEILRIDRARRARARGMVAVYGYDPNGGDHAPPASTQCVVLPFTPRPKSDAVAKDPRADDERGWIDIVSNETDAEYGLRIAHGYPDYYLSTHYQRVNEEYQTGRCARCGRSDLDTSLHHLNDHSFGREKREDLMELCDPCHAREQGRGVWKYRRAA